MSDSRDGDLARFRTAITRHLGMQFDDTRLGLLAEVFERRLALGGTSPAVYLHEFETHRGGREAVALAQELTVGETYFFRNPEQFHALSEITLPERMQVQAAKKILRVLSAGCSSGEEAYSIAITARESMLDPVWEIEVRGVDINSAALEKAQRARYSRWSLRGVSPAIEGQWFHRDGRELVLREAAKAGVFFEEANLASDGTLWRPQSFDVVFCRNVLMYFSTEQARAVIARIARALRPRGYLFLGHAETLRGLSDEFSLRHSHGTFYYQLKDDSTADIWPLGEPLTAAPAPLPIDGAVLDASWVEVIAAASARVDALHSASVAPSPAAVAATFPAWDLTAAFDLLKVERFAEALALVRKLPAASAQDPDVLLLTATLLAHSGQPDAAQDVCRTLLRFDDLNAGAYYVLALCREAQGDRVGAADNDRTAIYLDRTFAMPRLHLGLLARRRGDQDSVRHELTQAMALLQREEPSRLLLFGGGFSRDALLALCQSALREAGSAP